MCRPVRGFLSLNHVTGHVIIESAQCDIGRLVSKLSGAENGQVGDKVGQVDRWEEERVPVVGEGITMN